MTDVKWDNDSPYKMVKGMKAFNRWIYEYNKESLVIKERSWSPDETAYAAGHLAACQEIIETWYKSFEDKNGN